ncbi:MAG: DNA gyrase subunit A, partial [Rhodothermales bacterium]|nr:DNA gyrase subunit A [Rhodothermales bacterium]
AQGRGGVGSKGTGMRDEDFVEHLFVGNNHDYLMFFTDQGQCFWLRIFEIPEGSRTSKGRSIRNLIQIAPEDRIMAVLAVAKDNFRDQEFLDSHYVMMATRNGQVKKTQLEAFSRPRVDGIIAISVDEDDELLEAHMTGGDAHVVLAASSGLAIRFHEGDVRPTGRNTRGVRGIRLESGQRVVGMVVMEGEERDLLSISSNGYGKRSDISEYRVQSRGGKGLITMKTNSKTGELVAIKGVEDDNDLMISTVNGIMIRMDVGSISTLGRNTQGVRLIRFKDGDEIADVTKVVVEDEAEEAEEADEANEADETGDAPSPEN